MNVDDNGFLVGPKNFRCNSFDSIDLDNYVLFTGTSHTNGVGVEIEESYPYLVSKYFNYDYFNLAVGGTGTDVIEHNLLIWSYMFKNHQPKYVFVEWPPEERYLAKYPGYDNYIPVGNWSENKDVQELLIKGKKVFETRLELLYNITRSIFKCPIIDIRYSALAVTESIDNSGMIWLHRLDRGTDNAHPGPKSHKDVSKKIIEYILA